MCGPLSCFISARTQSTAAGPRGQAPCRPGAFAPALAERPVLQNSVQSSQNSPFRKSPPRHPVYLSAVLTTGQTSQFVVWDSDLCLFPRLKCKLHEDRDFVLLIFTSPEYTRGWAQGRHAATHRDRRGARRGGWPRGVSGLPRPAAGQSTSVVKELCIPKMVINGALLVNNAGDAPGTEPTLGVPGTAPLHHPGLAEPEGAFVTRTLQSKIRNTKSLWGAYKGSF